MDKENKLADIRITLLDDLLTDYQTKRGKAILDRCFDENFCNALGLKYGDKYNFSRIEQTLTAYENNIEALFKP